MENQIIEIIEIIEYAKELRANENMQEILEQGYELRKQGSIRRKYEKERCKNI